MDCTEGDETHEIGKQLIIARGDTTEVLEFVEEALDQIAFLVEVPITDMRPAAVMPGRDDGHGSGVKDGVVKVLGIVRPIGDDGAVGDALDQGRTKQHLAAMAGACNQVDGIAATVGDGVQLGA